MALQAFACNMRSVRADAEATLWRQLRAYRFAGHKFKRQQPIGNYIVDFVWFEARLVVEVDGGQHNESVADEARDEWLASQGFVVLRFWNNDVLQNIEGVLARILETMPPSPSIPLPRGEREALGFETAREFECFSSLPPGGGGTEGEGK